MSEAYCFTLQLLKKGRLAVMGITKIRRGLTQRQKAQGIVYSSQLVSDTKEKRDTDAMTHELSQWDSKRIELLENDSFFEGSHWKYNIIRS